MLRISNVSLYLFTSFILSLAFFFSFVRAYLDKHVNEVHIKLEACRPVREEVEKLEKVLCDNLGLKDIIWDCGWNIAHYRGCLLAFRALAEHHPESMEVLRNRTLVFANDTGISLEGNVMLNSGEVRHNWLDVSGLRVVYIFISCSCISYNLLHYIYIYTYIYIYHTITHILQR
jgi:hypothetical protein